MNNASYIAIFATVLSILEITSRTILKEAYDNKKILYVFISIVLYVIVISLLYFSMKYSKFITISALWDAGTIILATGASYFILKEEISRGEFIGLGLIIAGVCIMAYSTVNTDTKT